MPFFVFRSPFLGGIQTMIVVKNLLEAGKIEEAWVAAGDMTDYYHRALAALEIARRTRTVRDFEDAMALASHIEKSEQRREIEEAIRSEQAR